MVNAALTTVLASSQLRAGVKKLVLEVFCVDFAMLS
jgi:hypothetical protein